MSLSFFIARRYLFSKKSHNAINWISGIAVGGIALASLAMVIVLSVFNGFHDLLSDLYTTFDPQIKVTPMVGKYVDATDDTLQKMAHHPAVEASSGVVQDNALILFRGHPTVVVVKGVDDNWDKVTDIRSILYTGNGGEYLLHAADVEYAIPGSGLALQMGGADYGEMQICAPRGGERINLADPTESFATEIVNSPGVVFSVNQRKYDDNYLITSLGMAQRLFEHEGQLTTLELKLRPNANTDAVKKELLKIADGHYRVEDRMEQQEGMFGIMQIEKLLAYAFLTFILLVACFNIISSVSMLIIEKRNDVKTLHHIGLSHQNIVRIFLYEGRMISFLGGLIGVVLGVIICLLQEQYGFLRLGNSASTFIIDAYPVSVHLLDVTVVLLTAILVGSLATWYPVHYLSKKLL